MSSNFDIRIIDNFLDKDMHKKLKLLLPTLPYKCLDNILAGAPSSHVWFSHPTHPDIAELIKDKIEKIYNEKFEIALSSYTMLATTTPLPHSDKSSCDYQAIVYIKGNNNLHKGTGFYVLNEEIGEYELNTHIGFKENRVVIWESDAWHTPMNWASEEQSKRFSIIFQLKKQNKK